VIAVDPDETASVRRGQEVSPKPFTYKGKTWEEMSQDEKSQASKNAGIYGTKVKVNGETLYRKAVDVKVKDGKSPTYADYVAGANKQTQVAIFGGGEIGEDRADFFEKRLRARNGDAKRALEDLVKVPDDVRQRALARRQLKKEDAVRRVWKSRNELR
jgi:hypothetical protein